MTSCYQRSMQVGSANSKSPPGDDPNIVHITPVFTICSDVLRHAHYAHRDVAIPSYNSGDYLHSDCSPCQKPEIQGQGTIRAGFCRTLDLKKWPDVHPGPCMTAPPPCEMVKDTSHIESVLTCVTSGLR